MIVHLSWAKKIWLPHGLNGVVTQVFIVVVLYDGQQKPHNISRVLMKKRGALLKDGTFGRH